MFIIIVSITINCMGEFNRCAYECQLQMHDFIHLMREKKQRENSFEGFQLFEDIKQS